MTREVLLVPGLWMPAVAMGVLAARLRAQGFAVDVHAYPGRASLERNVEDLRSRLRGGECHLVGHSLGGLLILETLNRSAEVAAASVLLLGSPVRGCLAGRRFGRAGVGRWMMGATLSLWDERPARWSRPVPLGVLAGNRSLGLGRCLGALPGDNDGVVRVEETRVEGMCEYIVLPEAHSSMIFSRRVAEVAGRFLATGRFQ